MTNQTQHTPGPWTIQPSTHRNGEPTLEIQHGEVGEVVAYVDSVEQLPDARLIAAAPDLLEALVKLSPMFNNDNKLLTVYAAEVEACRAAIAKAGVEIL